MSHESVPRLSNAHRSLILGLSLSAAAGWGSFALSKHASGAMERQFRDQLTILQPIRSQLLTEQTKAQALLSQMAQLRGELATVRSEINQLSQSRGQSRADLPPVRPDAKGTSIRSDDTYDDVSRTGSIGEKSNKAQKDRVVSAKLPENQPRSQQIAAVRITAQGTQKSAERPQRGKALTIISELDTAALHRLTKSAEAQVR
jgi:hypothetical protein